MSDQKNSDDYVMPLMSALIELAYLKEAFIMIAEGDNNNARWMQQVATRALHHRPLPHGTCVDCPVDDQGFKEPHKCVHMGRLDHMLE